MTDPAYATSRSAGVRRAVIAATIGTIIEWFDYALYGSASGLIINKLFFPQFSAVGGVLASFATFAVGFFVRPLGGVLIAHLGDRFGRKPKQLENAMHRSALLNDAYRAVRSADTRLDYFLDLEGKELGADPGAEAKAKAQAAFFQQGRLHLYRYQVLRLVAIGEHVHRYAKQGFQSHLDSREVEQCRFRCGVDQQIQIAAFAVVAMHGRAEHARVRRMVVGNDLPDG